MVVPFGSALERRSRTTYRPTVTPEGSTHVDTFMGTTSSFSRTATGNLAVVAMVRQQVFERKLEVLLDADRHRVESSLSHLGYLNVPEDLLSTTY
jgi:hypothetical protein